MLLIEQSSRAAAYGYSVVVTRSLSEAERELSCILKGRRALIVTDEGVAKRHLPALEGQLYKAQSDFAVHTLRSGEKAKDAEGLLGVLSSLASGGFTRNDLVINLGGGAVSDVGGFAAAVYMRGIDYINIPTTLLGMADSAIGGKTGIDLFGVKNLVGCVHQPRLVVSSLEFLTTLPERELRSGLGEIVKYAAIGASQSLIDLVSSRDPFRVITAGGDDCLAVLGECARLKLAYVSGDECDRAGRRVLNLGHTFAHAIEAASGFSVSHGEAVALGLVLEAELGESLGYTDVGVSKELRMLAKNALPASEKSLAAFFSEGAKLLSHDKKSGDGFIEMPFVEKLGSPVLERVPLLLAADFLSAKAQ